MIIGNERQMFVLINVAVNVLLLGRSYVTMQVLDYRSLGLAALLQSIVLLVSMLQFGFLNGGFRLICSADEREADRINNLIYTVFGVIGVVALIGTAAVLGLVDRQGTLLVGLLGVVGGVFTLVRTWMTNRLVAIGRLRALNSVNFWSAAASLGAIGFVPMNPLVVCLVAIVIQPAAFVIAVAVLERDQLPHRLYWSTSLALSVLNAGFVVFLTGIFLQLNLQFERWYVTGTLGLAALGHLYLAFLFITLFQMVPTSFDQLFLPQIIQSYATEAGPRQPIRRYLMVIGGYCALAVAAVLLVAHPVTAWLLPRYVHDLTYIYVAIPGLVLFTLSGPFALMFNVVIRYRYYFIAYGAGSVATGSILFGALFVGSPLSLIGVMWLRSGVYALMAVLLTIGYHRLLRHYPEFDLALWWRRRRAATV